MSNTLETNQYFVEMLDETVATVKDTNAASDPLELESTIRNSWDYDDQKRREAFVGGYKEFRQHVLNLLDAENDN